VIETLTQHILNELALLAEPQKIEALNNIKAALHEVSPFRAEPVDCVLWVPCDEVIANDYNPNKVAPPEMELLEVSILNDGYTQPIVSWKDPNTNKIEVVDGFHRNRVGKESKIVRHRVKGYLPIVDIRKEQAGKNDRIASTIRHNRARGKHQIDAMSEIVIELKNRNWSNARISKQLGMDEEEVLRLCQISGLEHLFNDQDFSKAWESSDVAGDFEPITDDVSEEMSMYRIPNERDSARVFHTFHAWECHKAGFYASRKEGVTKEEGKKLYAEFLSDDERFKAGLKGVTSKWKNSCEHYLTNRAMNRIAWLGQAAMCYSTEIPSIYCSGFNLLSAEQQQHANEIAYEAFMEWAQATGRDEDSIEECLSTGRQSELY
jgi:ParB-like chromosome segregation protein Spo0J